MALKTPKKLKNFEFKSGNSTSYDWATLLDGSIYECKAGENYECKTNTFGTMARGQAKKARKNIKVSIKCDYDEDENELPGGTVVLQASPMTDAEIAELEAKEAAKEAEEAASEQAA